MAQDVILLVEDNADEAELASMALEQSVSVRVVRSRDGAEALAYLREHEAPLVVLLDLKLPKLSGLEVLRTLKSEPRTRLIPVVVMTNSLDEGDVAAAYAHGCNSYVRKQVDWFEFKETIRQIGLYWVGLNQKIPKAAPERAI